MPFHCGRHHQCYECGGCLLLPCTTRSEGVHPGQERREYDRNLIEAGRALESATWQALAS
jgi:hypothetical protein